VKRTRSLVLPQFPAIVGRCLGHTVYRGFAALKDLAAVSKADVFDQRKNPTGTQRNLNRQHARKAYDYVLSEDGAFYPEIILNIRDRSYVKFHKSEGDGGVSFGKLEFVKNPNQSKSVVVSRLDGNHRLWFVDGHEKGMDAIGRLASFCFLMLADLDEELALFRAINDNQMGMNTSHLQNITARLLGTKSLKATDPSLYIVQQLQKDKTSPFFKRIHEGGVLERGATLAGLTTANLKNAVKDMLTRSAKLAQFPDADAQFELIKNYWLAVQKWLPGAWKRPGDYIIFKGVGILAITYLGIEVIDRCLLKGKYGSDDMLAYLKQLPSTDSFLAKAAVPYAGRAGAKKMASDLISDLEEEGEVSLSKLQKMILGG
jgi:DGQHR domain-containing protein